ncbi:hypothetical protein ACWDRX_37900, partial [Streptomyces nigra]
MLVNLGEDDWDAVIRVHLRGHFLLPHDRQSEPALADLLEPDRAALRRPPEQIAALFFGLLFTQPRTDDEPDLTPTELVDVFLHGAVSSEGR